MTSLLCCSGSVPYLAGACNIDSIIPVYLSLSLTFSILSFLFSGSYDKTIHIWDLRSHMREPVQSLTDFTDSVTAITLSRSEISASCVDGKVRTYDLRMGRMHVDEFYDPVTFLRLSYDQRCALSTCLNGVLRLTEVASGKVLQSYSGSVCESVNSLLLSYLTSTYLLFHNFLCVTGIRIPHIRLRLISPMTTPE